MASPYPVSNRYKITPSDHGNILKIGNASETDVGTYEIHFVPDATWDGELAVMGRIDHANAQADSVPFVPVPYRKVYLNTAAGDYSLVSTSISSTSILQVPASALTVGVLVSCAAGYGYLYSKPLHGPATP